MVASLIPPSACPARLADIREAWRSGKESADSIERFCSVLASRTGKPHAFAFNQARTALAILLQELHRLRSERFEVIVPAYTCYTVAAAVARAGLVMVPVDIEPSDLCFKLQALQDSINERTLAIIVVHPFGQPCDIGAVKGVISNRHIFIVEDCAQAWDTRYRGHFLGGEGDASIFSFGRGKHLNLGGGGICCVGEGEIAYRLEQRMRELPAPSQREHVRRLLKLVFTIIGQHPYIYAYALRVPFLGIGETYFDDDFAMIQWSGWQAQLGLRLLRDWESMASRRRRNADFWREWLQRDSVLGVIPQVEEPMNVVYLRMPVLSRDRQRAMRWFRKRGIHAQKMYPTVLADIDSPHLKVKVYSTLDGARRVTESLYTLPVHPLFDAKRWAARCSRRRCSKEEMLGANTIP